MEKTEETRDRIMEAAQELFGHYGFSKTTMAEIAEKCGMSAANIYRFFDSKEEIVAAGACSYMRQVEQSLREVVRQPGLKAGERLEKFILTMVGHAHNLCCCNEKMGDAVKFIEEKRSDLVQSHKEAVRSMLAEILAEGNQSGEFDTEDIVGAAGVILDAVALYKSPACLSGLSQEQAERSVGNIVRLCIRGLGKR